MLLPENYGGGGGGGGGVICPNILALEKSRGIPNILAPPPPYTLCAYASFLWEFITFDIARDTVQVPTTTLYKRQNECCTNLDCRRSRKRMAFDNPWNFLNFLPCPFFPFPMQVQHVNDTIPHARAEILIMCLGRRRVSGGWCRGTSATTPKSIQFASNR